MVVNSGLLGGYIIPEGLAVGSGGFDASVTVQGVSTTNYDGQVAVARTSLVSQFDAKLCVEIEATQISPSAQIVTPTVSNSSGLPTFYVAFSGNGFTSGLKTIDKYTWFFNDINTTVSGGQTTEHEFTSSGEFLVTLRVTDSDGLVAFASRRIKTYSGIALDMPRLDTSGVTATGGAAPLFVDFTSSGSGVTGTTVNAYSWSFGHGKFSGRQDQNDVVYNTPGNWVAVCTMVDSRGVKMADSVQVGVNN